MRGFIIPILRFLVLGVAALIRFFQFLQKKVVRNPFLSAVLLIGFLVRFIGLYPNDIYNADEMYVRDKSAAVFERIVTTGDFDPHTYKYGSFIFYWGALPYWYVYPSHYIADGFSLQKYAKQENPNVLFAPPAGNHTTVSFAEYVQGVGMNQWPEQILRLQRFSIALLGSLTVYVLYLIGKYALNRQIGIVAAALLAVSPMHVRDSHYLTTDVPFALAILLSILCMLIILKKIIKKRLYHIYIVTGLVLGLASTIRYFPIALVTIPFFVGLAWKKSSRFMFNTISMLFSVPLGIVLSVPFLFIFFKTNIPLFIEEMNKYVLPWYQTPISTYLSTLAGKLFGSDTPLPPLSSFAETVYQPVYFRLMYLYGVGAIAFFLMFAGIVILLLKYRRASLLLLPVPLILFFYLSVYIQAKYDRLMIPLIPFASLFAAIAVAHIYELLIKLPKKRFAYIQQSKQYILPVLTVIVIAQSFTHSVSASIQCSGEHSYFLGLNWMVSHIPPGSKILYKLHMLVPSDIYDVAELRPWNDFYLEEARIKEADYVFFNINQLIYSMGSLIPDHFMAPAVLKENYYITLAQKEYDDRAQKVHEILYEDMCEMPDMKYYKMPEALPVATQVIQSSAFDSESELSKFKLYPYKQAPSDAHVSYDSSEGHDKPGSLAYSWTEKKYVLPRIISEKIPVSPGGIYTVSGWVLFSEPLYENAPVPSENEPDGFFRIDFENDENYDIMYPGDSVALSPRYFGDRKWKQLSVTAQAPQNTRYMHVSFQINGVKNSGTYYIDDLVIAGP